MEDETINDLQLGINQIARERALRVLDYLGDLYTVKFPAVYAIDDYREIQLPKSRFESAQSVEVGDVDGSWLRISRPEFPIAPKPLSSLCGWIVGTITSDWRPSVIHPDETLRRLIQLLETPHNRAGKPVEIADLTDSELTELGFENEDATTLAVRSLDAQAELVEMTQRAQEWYSSSVEPWQTRYKEVAATRNLFDTFFDLRGRLEREGDIVELVWGFGWLKWTTRISFGEAKINYPLLTTEISISWDQDSNVLLVTPNNPLELDLRWIHGIDVSDRESLREEEKHIATYGLDPWNDDLREELQRVARAINYGGVLKVDDLPSPPDDTAVIDPDQWMIFLRRRQPNFQQYVEDLRNLYTDPEVKVPPAFAAVVTDEPSLFDQVDPYAYINAEDENASPGPLPIQKMLLPLPSNEEQELILRFAMSKAGVTAQGPPGTGKSHTIANLVCHFLAHGKRVLVTAEKEQALKVLLDKIPADIRDLCVSIIGNDARSRLQLRDSVSRIAGVATETVDASKISRLEGELESLSEKIAQLMNEQRQAREAEITAPPLPSPHGGPSPWTPSSAAQWLSERADDYRGIQDSLGIDTCPPLTDTEFEELCELLKHVPEEDRTDALQALPDSESLPTVALLLRQWQERREIQTVLKSMGTVRQENSKDVELSRDLLEELARELDEWATWLTYAQGSWLQSVISDARDELRSQPWRDFCEHFDADTKEIANELRRLSEYEISTPDSISELKEVLEQSLARVQDGKRAGKRFDRRSSEALAACRIDGRNPVTENDFRILLRYLKILELRRRLRTRWTNLPLAPGAPELGDSTPIERVLYSPRQQIGGALNWKTSASPELTKRVIGIGLVPQGMWSPATLRRAVADVRILRQEIALRELDSKLGILRDTLEAGVKANGSSHVWRELLGALDQEDGQAWSAATRETERLRVLAPNAQRLFELINSLRTVAPHFANTLQTSEKVLSVPLSQAWHWRQVETWLDELLSSVDTGKLQLEIERLTLQRRRVISDLVTSKAWASVIESIDDRRRSALNNFVTANAKLGKGKGKYAPRWEQEIRAALDRAKDAVPVWIMPIHRVIASFRPTAEPPFDVIIVDEASQVSLLNLPILGLARQAIVVGDERQTSPENVGLDLQITHQMIDRHLISIVDRATRFDVNNSLYDLSRQQFPKVVQLREHFRCLPRIIEFSSDQWYEGQIIPLRDRPPKPGWKPLGSVFVKNGARRPNDDVNVQEAKAVCALIESMIADEDYTGMNFGVVTLLGKGQARYIQDQLLDRLGPAVIDERRIRCGEPAGFQGDERDIIILSMVIAHDPERRIGAMTKETDERRINVAASRAANQMWIVHSVMPNDLHPEDPRRKLLEHCLSEADEERRARQEKATDSQFERDVLRMILNAGYTEVTTQYEVGKFRIDIVIEGPEQRLAVECDGDTWHGPDRWEYDRNRQSVLERAGWTFVRIRGSAFYHDRQRALEPLWDRLEELGIPKGDWPGTTTDHKIRRIWPLDFSESSSEFNGTTEMGSLI